MSELKNIGLDIGFGDVKVAVDKTGSETGNNTINLVKYPTAIAYSKDGIIGDLADNQDEFDFNGRKYLVGNTALQCRDIFSTRDMDFLLTYSPLLAYKAINDIDNSILSENKRICLGIPLGHYKFNSNLKKKLSNYTISNKPIHFNLVEVRAQGQGILFDYMLDDDGKPISERINQNILIIDIGFNTVDILGVIEGRPNKEWSDMIENGGICRICEELKSYLRLKINFDLSEQSIKEVIQKGEISIYGVQKDLSTPIRKINEAYSDWLSQEVKTRWDGFLKRADKLIIAGGGAYYIKNDFQKLYPNDFIFIPDQPEFSNARGFLKFIKKN